MLSNVDLIISLCVFICVLGVSVFFFFFFLNEPPPPEFSPFPQPAPLPFWRAPPPPPRADPAPPALPRKDPPRPVETPAVRAGADEGELQAVRRHGPGGEATVLGGVFL